MSKKLPTPWKGVPRNTSSYYGFVYLITNLTNDKKYIGRKYFWAKRKRKLFESDWKVYKSSCKELVSDIKKLGVDKFKFEILHLCKTRGNTNYMELKEQVLHEVLERKDYYNSNILSRFFRTNI